MIRIAVTAALVTLMSFFAYQLLERWVLVMLTVLMLAMSGCSYYIVPAGRPKVRYCYPANSWRCDPRIEWSQM